jgi:Patatin-like phospholipase
VKTSKTNNVAAYLCRRIFRRNPRRRVLFPQPQSPDAVPAHILWVELATRITTQPLHYRSGDEETAADSIYKLFPKVRELMEKHPNAKVFNELSLQLLNECLRPYTARWHGWLNQQETGNGKLRFGDELIRRMFREELRELQPRLLWFQAAFKAVSEGSPISEEKSEPTPIPKAQSQSAGKQANLGPSLAAGIGPQIKLYGDFPNALSSRQVDEKEQKFILERRRIRNPESATAEMNDAIGLAFSGGGIRSATVCLGVVQVLAKNELLAEVDYLSTVSGGGYFGSFLSSYLTPHDPKESLNQSIKKALNPDKDGIEAAAVRHLRNNSKYLLHGGLWGKLQIAGLLASGLATNILMVLPLPLLAVLLIYLLSFLGFWGHQVFKANAVLVPSLDTFIGRILELTFLATVSFWFVLVAIRRKTLGQHPDSPLAKLRGFWSAATLVLSISLCLACVSFALPGLFHAYAALGTLRRHLGGPLSAFLSQEVVVALIGALPFISAAATAMFKQQWIKNLSARLLFFSGPLLYVWIILFVGAKLGLTGDHVEWQWWAVSIVTALLLFWSWLFVDINSGGPHGYYRDRLCECYLAYQGQDRLTWWQGAVRRFWSGRKRSTHNSSQPLRSVGTRLQMPITELATPGAAPYHLLNTVVNLPASANRELRGRNGDFFLLSPHVCGSPICGYVETSKLIGSDPHLDLGTAMAISGAAAAPNMGWRTLANYRFLLALFNVRLGYWIPSVRQLDKIRTRGVGPRYFLAEITGQINENMRYLNISDGGHIENLGVYELLRRKCKFIICVHGGADFGTERSDLQRLERYASIDLGITLEYKLADLQPDVAKICRAYAILIKVLYGPDEIGWMIYLKPTITGAEPQYVLDYRYQNANFPHDGIFEQTFDEERFEAYRAVGECAAESLFRPEIVGNTKPGTIRDWFQNLADNLLPDNDPAFLSTRTQSPIQTNDESQKVGSA